jgi:hypothetical protein
VPVEGHSANRGLARERTALAWNRSGLAVVVCIAVLLRRFWPLKGGYQLFALGLVAIASVVWAVTIVFIWILQSGHQHPPSLGSRRLAMLSASTAILGVGAMMLTFFTPG